MKVFWAIMAVLALGAGAMWFLRSPKAESAEPSLAYSDTATEPPKAAAPPAAPKVGSAAAPAAQQPAKTSPATTPAANPAPAGDDLAVDMTESVNEQPLIPTPAPAPPTVAAKPSTTSAPQAETPKTTETPKTAEAPKTTTTAATPAAADPGKSSPDPKPATPTKPTDAAKPETKTDTKPDAKVESKPDPKTEAKPSAAKVESPAGLNVRLEPQEDGSTLVDGKYVIKGVGTKEDPYRVTWEMLTSVEETYRPRLGKKVIPDRVKMLDGKFVRISGYIAFPVMASSGDEMLMMLNQWDGCCIGVPPTPYDAIEVKLKAAAKGNDRLRTSGTLSGKFKVDPYLVKDWLISLYVMDDGELSETKGTANPGMHAGSGGP
jgi:hypothetical protein